jgi:hypothetical protein
MSKLLNAVVAALLVPVCANAAGGNDLRDFRIGMAVSALPTSGYGEFACAADPSKKLSDWGGYQTCPASQDGTRAVSFRYDDGGPAGDEGKTQVAGQPVELALLIGDNGRVTGIKIDTDPHARLYLHKKAFLFGLQIRARFAVWRRRMDLHSAIAYTPGTAGRRRVYPRALRKGYGDAAFCAGPPVVSGPWQRSA